MFSPINYDFTVFKTEPEQLAVVRWMIATFLNDLDHYKISQNIKLKGYSDD